MKRTKHSLSHYRLLTADMGKLIPIALYPVLPGDSVQQATSLLLRANPLAAPVMHPVSVRVHHWFVPNRLIWEDWEKFITGGSDGEGDGAVFPTITTGAVTVGSLSDYLGLPVSLPPGSTVSAMPYRVYNLIWNEFYRDQDLQTPVAETSQTVKFVNWNKDYFTTARPWPQKGGGITVPIKESGGDGRIPVGRTSAGAPPAATQVVHGSQGAFGSFEAPLGTFETLEADLSTAYVEIDDLREAFALQRYGEARARFGSRYTEYLAYLGVRSGDARLQRPEYLGGGKSTISFSEVLQTAEGTDPVGQMAGHGITAFRSPRYRKFFSEHGYVMTLMFVRPKSMYVSGTPKMFLKGGSKEDFWQKELEHIGQQGVATMELFNNSTALFGYQDRYDEYRRQWSSVSGEFKTVLNYWHMGRIFASAPTLNEDFIKCDPSKRNFAEQTQHSLYAMVHHKIGARRLVSSSGTSFVR